VSELSEVVVDPGLRSMGGRRREAPPSELLRGFWGAAPEKLQDLVAKLLLTRRFTIDV